MNDKILMLGAGRMGGALLKGWALKDAIDPAFVIVRDPHVGPEVAASGAAINPPDVAYKAIGVVLLAVKPQMWREAVAALPPLADDVVVVSIAAGVRAGDISAAFNGAR